jgi:hypothetical protein
MWKVHPKWKHPSTEQYHIPLTAVWPQKSCLPDNFLCTAQNIKMFSKCISFRWNVTSPSCDHFVHFLQLVHMVNLFLVPLYLNGLMKCIFYDALSLCNISFVVSIIRFHISSKKHLAYSRVSVIQNCRVLTFMMPVSSISKYHTSWVDYHTELINPDHLVQHLPGRGGRKFIQLPF